MDQQTKDPDVLNVLVLERVDRTKNMARYYVLSVEPTLFAESSLVRRWGRIGGAGRTRIDLHASRRSRRQRSTHGSNASGAAVTDSAADCRLSALCGGTPSTARHSQRACNCCIAALRCCGAGSRPYMPSLGVSSLDSRPPQGGLLFVCRA